MRGESIACFLLTVGYQMGQPLSASAKINIIRLLAPFTSDEVKTVKAKFLEDIDLEIKTADDVYMNKVHDAVKRAADISNAR